jgi:hypothetical protein
MPGIVFAVIVAAFAIVAVILIRRTQRGAFVDRLPLGDDEHVLLEEEGLEVSHRFRRMSVRGGWTTTHRVRSSLTDRRILLATGGPEGKHKFVILMILDYTSESPSVPETGYAAYRRKFGLASGYPTYSFSRSDLAVDGDHLQFVIRFPEAGERWGDPPEVRLSTPNAARYEDAIVNAGRAASASPRGR